MSLRVIIEIVGLFVALDLVLRAFSFGGRKTVCRLDRSTSLIPGDESDR